MLIHITIDHMNHDRRLDHFLRSFYAGTPTSHLHKLMRCGHIRINQKKIKASARIYSGDSISLPQASARPSLQYSAKQSAVVQNAIIYENEHYLIIDKPDYIPVQRGTGHDNSMIDMAEAHYQHPLHLVHRLDLLTSGVMVIAKHPSMQKTLSALFKERKVHKVYHCVVGHWPHPDTMTVDAPLLRVRQQFMDTSVVDAAGKDSITHFTVLRQCAGLTLIEARPLTGRMHQIRAHCAHICAPILGDVLYNRDGLGVTTPGLMLLSQSLMFPDITQRMFHGQWPEAKRTFLENKELLDNF